MMKRLSIRFKITFWFTMALIVVVLFTFIVVISVGNQIVQKIIKDNLIVTVEDNVDEIEFYYSIEGIDLSSDVDHFMSYADGYLEVDDDFLDEVNEVYTALYDSDSNLLYGENPISKAASDLKFIDSQIQTVTVDGLVYYIFDRKLTSEGLEDLWLRGVVSQEQGDVQMSIVTRTSLFIMPFVVLIAALGGYLIAGRMLFPIKKISETARQIGKENNLKKRIELGNGTDELHRLADSFNDMFEKLDKSFEAQRQFTSDVSHELRTPMSVITAQCEYTLENPRSAAEYEEALKVIQRQGRKMSRLINDMLDFSRLEVGSDKYVKTSVNMTALVSSICTDMALINENGIELEYKAEENIFIEGNYDLLSRLVTNLVSNAYRYGKTNGHIYVGLDKENENARLSVEDDGTGISDDDLEKIFNRFYRSDSARDGTGLGLGLSMAQEIARFHGGEIKVESKLGKGSIFTVILPL